MDHGSNITNHMSGYVRLADMTGHDGEVDYWRRPSWQGLSGPTFAEQVAEYGRNIAAHNGAPALIAAETARTQGRAA